MEALFKAMSSHEASRLTQAEGGGGKLSAPSTASARDVKEITRAVSSTRCDKKVRACAPRSNICAGTIMRVSQDKAPPRGDTGGHGALSLQSNVSPDSAISALRITFDPAALPVYCCWCKKNIMGVSCGGRAASKTRVVLLRTLAQQAIRAPGTYD